MTAKGGSGQERGGLRGREEGGKLRQGGGRYAIMSTVRPFTVPEEDFDRTLKQVASPRKAEADDGKEEQS